MGSDLKRSSRAWAFASLFALAIGGHAYASEPDENAKKTARNFMQEGRDLRDEKNYKDSLEAFKKAHAIMGVPTTGIEVARTMRLLGQLVEASKFAAEIAASEPKPKEPEPFQQARDEAKKLVLDLDAIIPTLRVKVKGDAKAEVRVDDKLADDPQKIRVNPGKHKVVVRGAKDSKSAEITLGEGDSKDLSFDFSPPAPATSSAPPPPPPTTVKADTSDKKTLMYIGFGAGGVGLALGAITGLMAKSKADAAKKDCVDGKCPPSTHGDISSGKSMATLSNIGFVIAIAGAGVGTYALMTNKPKKEKTDGESARWVSPYVGAGNVGITGGF